jgi:hypothetical protein
MRSPAMELRKSSGSIRRMHNWNAPKGIAIYLSKIELPDLKPGRRPATNSKAVSTVTANEKSNGSLATPAPLSNSLAPTKKLSGGDKVDGKGSSSLGRLFRSKS